MAISQPSKGVIFFIAFLLWSVSAFASYVLALLSVNTTIINVVFLADIACLMVAFFLASKQKIVAAFIVAVAPAPATVSFAMAMPYIARVLHNAI